MHRIGGIIMTHCEASIHKSRGVARGSCVVFAGAELSAPAPEGILRLFRAALLAGTALSLGMVAYGGQASAACVGPVDGVVTCSPGDYGSITYINPDDQTFELDVGEEGEETTITPPAGEHGIAVWHKIGRAHV